MAGMPAACLTAGDRAARDASVAAYRETYARWREAERMMVSDPDAQAAWRSEDARMKAMEAGFLLTLPVYALARCPYTGQVVSGRVDAFGTGSPWWMDEGTVREEFAGPSTLFAVDGALTLTGVPEASPFTVQPGPERPCVIPEILRRPEIKAVLRGTPIDGGMIWWMVYFAWPPVLNQARVNDFARDCYAIRLDSGTLVRYADTYPVSACDFSLEPWIQAGKLLWIAPEDPLPKLHATAKGCPYLALPGQARKQVLQGSWKGWLDTPREAVETGGEGLDRSVADSSFQKGLAFVKGAGRNG